MNPSPQTIRAARRAAGQSQAKAAALVYYSKRAWQFWEAGDKPMPAAVFELYRLKTRQTSVRTVLSRSYSPE